MMGLDDINSIMGIMGSTLKRGKRQILALGAGSLLTIITNKIFGWFSPAVGNEQQILNIIEKEN